jgi:thiol:disulfide interchange protein DsbC
LINPLNNPEYYMSSKTPMALLGLTLAIVTTIATAADDSAEALALRLKTMYPATKVDQVQRSEIPGLFEVVMGKNAAYTDTSGRYFVFGHLFDMKEQRDLTAERVDKAARIAFSELPLVDAIKTVRGKGERILAVFSDPDCPYCRKLETELDKLDNVTVYTFTYPMEGLHPEAKDKSIAVWCAPNRSSAWSGLMKSGKAPSSRSCENPIERNIQLGQRLGIQGTPTMLSADGRTLPGAAPKDRIEQWLAEGAR